LGRGVKTIDCFRGNADRRIESKTDVSAAQIVIDGLGHADARYTLLNQCIGHALRIVSANRDQRVQLIALNGGDTLLYTARLFADVRTRGAQNGSSQLQDPRDALNRQRHRLVFQNTSPAFQEANKLIAVMKNAFAHSRTNHSVQAGTVPATRKNSNPHDAFSLNTISMGNLVCIFKLYVGEGARNVRERTRNRRPCGYPRNE